MFYFLIIKTQIPSVTFLSIIAAVEPTSFPGNFIYTATFDSFSDFIDEGKKKSQQIVKLLGSFMAIFSALLILLDFWWTHTVIKAYRFFVDYQRAKRDNLKMEPEYHAQTFFD
uniref:Uncharacterized protein n=1 Tax=Rhabditophanes sp. KR3021 TaxID=114890 RepID=A0AC35U083_9BILA